jgi:3-isopropylmalate/(R)-2-methylmalate dehydratase small subunit
VSDLPERGSAVRRVAGTGLPLPGDDVDTDQIVPARFLKEVTFDEMGEYVFYDERRDDEGDLGDHPFDRPAYQGARILVVGENFGCGSSREHAPQALLRWGIRGIVGVSFAEIFADNCSSLGVPTVTADREISGHSSPTTPTRGSRSTCGANGWCTTAARSPSGSTSRHAPP